MTRFTDQQCVTVDGQNLTFKTRPAGLVLAAAAAVPGLIAQAKVLLQRTGQELGRLGWSRATRRRVQSVAIRFATVARILPPRPAGC